MSTETIPAPADVLAEFASWLDAQPDTAARRWVLASMPGHEHARRALSNEIAVYRFLPAYRCVTITQDIARAAARASSGTAPSGAPS